MALVRLPVVFTLAAVLVMAQETMDWTRFRGPNGCGISEGAPLPDRIGPESNVLWKVPVPLGHSSPVLTGTKIFLTAVHEDELVVLCLDRNDGRELWRAKAPRPRRSRFDKRNNGASPTPVVDDDVVVVSFPEYGLLGYDHDGEELWRVPLGPFNNLYGMGASPVLHGDRVFLPCDQQLKSFLVCVHKRTGKLLWRVNRPMATSGHCTPVVWAPKGEDPQLILPGSFYLDAYDMKTGARVWWVSGLAFEMKSVPAIHDGKLYINGYATPLNQPGNQIDVGTFKDALAANDGDKDGKISREEMPRSRASRWFGFVDLDSDKLLDAAEWQYMRDALSSMNGMLAIKLGGEGDMTEKNHVWSYRRSVPQLPSPLVYGDVLYMLNDQGGLIVLLHPDTGEVIVRGRLEDAMDSYYASPVAGDGKIYFVGQHGKISVLRRGGGLKPVSVSDLGEQVYATPAIQEGRIYLRSVSTLYCFGNDQGAGGR